MKTKMKKLITLILLMFTISATAQEITQEFPYNVHVKKGDLTVDSLFVVRGIEYLADVDSLLVYANDTVYKVRLYISSTKDTLIIGNDTLVAGSGGSSLFTDGGSYVYTTSGDDIRLPNIGDAVQFGDGDSEWKEASDDVLQAFIAGSVKLGIESDSTSFYNNAVPATSNTYDLGSENNVWAELYTDNITDDGTNVTLSAGAILGNSSTATNGNIRWTGSDFEGYKSGAWTSFTATGGGGEVNTASNLGAGIGVYEQKSTYDLQFNSLVSQTDALTISEDDGNNEIDFTIQPDTLINGYGILTLLYDALVNDTVVLDSATVYQALRSWIYLQDFSSQFWQDNGTTVQTADGEDILLPTVGDRVIWGDSDTYQEESSDDALDVRTAGTLRWRWSTSANRSYQTLIPSSDNVYSLGGASNKWSAFYSDNITDDGTNVSLSAGAIFGNSTTTTSGNIRWTGTDFEGYMGTGWLSLTDTGSTITVNNQANNRIITATSSSDVLNAEANLQFNGTYLDIDVESENGLYIVNKTDYSGAGEDHFSALQFRLLDTSDDEFVYGRFGAIITDDQFESSDGMLFFQTACGSCSGGIKKVAFLNDTAFTLHTGFRFGWDGQLVDDIETTLSDDDTHIPTSGAVYRAITAGSGEINTASNLGSGAGVYEQKVTADLQFNSLNSESSILTIAEDDPNNTIDFTLDPENHTVGWGLSGSAYDGLIASQWTFDSATVLPVVRSWVNNQTFGVQAVGTPANDQIAVWTNSNTLEGTSNLTFSSNTLTTAGTGIVKSLVQSTPSMSQGTASVDIANNSGVGWSLRAIENIGSYYFRLSKLNPSEAIKLTVNDTLFLFNQEIELDDINAGSVNDSSVTINLTNGRIRYVDRSRWGFADEDHTHEILSTGWGLTGSNYDGSTARVFAFDSTNVLPVVRAWVNNQNFVDAHASTHITSGSDEINGDQLDIDWNPSNYTPSTSPSEATSVDHLTAHLYGIDQSLSGFGAGTVTSIGYTQPSAGFTISGTNPITGSGTWTFALADDLNALEGLSSTGLAVRTGTSTWTNRQIAGTSNQISVSNGTGVSGNPTISISSNPVLSGTASLTVPSGTTAQRPVSPVNGMIRYNSSLTEFEVYQNSSWTQFGTGNGTVTSVGLSMPSQFSVSGSPVTSSGTLTASWQSQSQNLVFASPSSGSGAPTFRSLVAGDLPAHASTHITGASDEIDGDQLDVDWTPTNYTPSTTPSEATNADNLTAHLYGIDQELGSAGGGDVYLYPTPSADHVAVWRSGNTIEGDDDFTFDGTDVTLANDINVGANIAHTGDADTYIGLTTNDIKIFAGGVQQYNGTSTTAVLGSASNEGFQIDNSANELSAFINGNELWEMTTSGFSFNRVCAYNQSGFLNSNTNVTVAYNQYFFDDLGGSRRATLPSYSSANDGTTFWIFNNDATYQITIAVQSGDYLNGVEDGTYNIQTSYGAMVVKSPSSTVGWMVQILSR